VNRQLVYYRWLLDQFLNRAMPVNEFQTTYLNRFKREEPMGEPLFSLLDELFGDVDSFTTDEVLLAENPRFYLDETQLRARVQQVSARIAALER